MTTANRVALKTRGGLVYEEAKASVGTIRPGHVVQLNSSGELALGPSYLGNVEKMIALEDGLRGSNDLGGRDLWDAYDSGEQVPYMIAQRGDEVAVRLAIGQNVAQGDLLISFGDGTVVRATATISAANLTYTTVAASATITNTTTETDFSQTAVISANTLKAGDLIRVQAHAVVSSSNSTDTLTVKLKIGSTTIVSTGALDVANNDVVLIDALLVVRTFGASGTFVASGIVNIGVPGTATVKAFNLASTTIDTTVNQTIKLTGQWSVAHASNVVALQSLVVRTDPVDDDVYGYFGAFGRAVEAVNNSAGSDSALLAIRVL